VSPLSVLRVADIEPREAGEEWLVQQLWGRAAVGFVAGAPKSLKSWLALDMAVSVASGTACLGHFPVDDVGPALVYLAEDHLAAVRQRVEALCEHRALDLCQLDLHVIAAPSLRLDLPDDLERLDQVLEELQPRLLVLDPLVRLHRCDENSSAEVSSLLGALRELNRRHEVAIVVVHHMSKKARAHLGQALRGSGDLHAWTDSACYLVHRGKGELRLTVEHRAGPAPEPMRLRLVNEGGLHLHLGGTECPKPPLAEAVRAALREADGPRTRAALRSQLAVNNARLGEALVELERRGLVRRGPKGWRPAQQLTLV
jgi:RecA-family ATPase